MLYCTTDGIRPWERVYEQMMISRAGKNDVKYPKSMGPWNTKLSFYDFKSLTRHTFWNDGKKGNWIFLPSLFLVFLALLTHLSLWLGKVFQAWL